jgi:hypothetical protein
VTIDLVGATQVATICGNSMNSHPAVENQKPVATCVAPTRPSPESKRFAKQLKMNPHPARPAPVGAAEAAIGNWFSTAEWLFKTCFTSSRLPPLPQDQ